MNHFTLVKKAATVAIALAASLTAAHAQGTITLLENFMYVEGMSDNGRYVTGHNGESGWIYDSEAGQIATLIDGHAAGVEIKDVSNSGQVVGYVGSASGIDAAVWTDGVLDTTTFDDVPVAGSYSIRSLTCISGDGTIRAGYVSTGWDATAYMWHNGQTVRLDVPEADPDGIPYMQAVPLGISPDNRYILGRLSNDYGDFRVGLWRTDSLAPATIITMREPELGWDGVTATNPSVEPICITPNGKIIANDEEGNMYAYDIAADSTTIIQSPSAGMAINAFGDNYVTATANTLLRSSYIVTPDGEVPMHDYFFENYEVEIVGDSLADTGTMTCVSADETAFAGMSFNTYYDEQMGWETYAFLGYHIKIDKQAAGICLSQAIEQKPTVKARGGAITISGANGNATVSITDMAGRTHAAQAMGQGGQYRVGQGIYIVNIRQGNNRYIYKVAVE